MMTLQPWVLGGEKHLGVEESFPYPEGRVLCQEQVKTEADATEGKGNKHNVWSLGRDNEHVVLL
jgi:hypothetical protein